MQQVNKGLRTIEDLPSPKTLPFLGNAHQIKLNHLHNQLENWMHEHGDMYSMKLMNKRVVVIGDESLANEILKNRPHLFRRAKKLDNVLRELGVNGVFNSEGENWKKQRRITSQALNQQHLNNFFPQLLEVTNRFINTWSQKTANGEGLILPDEFMRYTVDTTTLLAFGYDGNTIESKDDVIQEHLEKIFPAAFRRINAPFPYWKYFKTKADKEVEASFEVIRQFIDEIIDKARAAKNKELTKASNFLEALIASSKDNELSNDEIFGNVLTMLLAGEDTTANTMAWMVYFMDRYPDVQEKMHKEALDLMGDNKCISTLEALNELRYTEAVAMESMRLKPVSPLLLMQPLEEITIGNTLIPEGTVIFLQNRYAGLQNKNFSEPGEFMPERWLMKACPAHKNHNTDAFLPFGAGSRFCPGRNLAFMEIKILMSALCRNFQINIENSIENIQEVMSFTMTPSPFKVNAEQIEIPKAVI